MSHSAAPVASVQFQAESARWYPLTLRAPKKAGAGKRRGKKARGAAGQAGGGAATGSGDADHEEADGTPDAADHGGDAGDLATDGAEPDGEAAATAADGEAAEAPVYPSPRFNAQLAVQRNILYLYGAGVRLAAATVQGLTRAARLICRIVGGHSYGGLVEVEDQEITLSDLYALNLDKLDKFEVLQAQPTETTWESSDSEDDGSGDDDDSDDGSGSGSDDSSSDDEADSGKPAAAASAAVPAAAPAAPTGAPAAAPDEPAASWDDDDFDAPVVAVSGAQGLTVR